MGVVWDESINGLWDLDYSESSLKEWCIDWGREMKSGKLKGKSELVQEQAG